MLCPLLGFAMYKFGNVMYITINNKVGGGTSKASEGDKKLFGWNPVDAPSEFGSAVNSAVLNCNTEKISS